MDIIGRDEWKAQPPLRRRPTAIDPADMMGWVLHSFHRAVKARNADAEAARLREWQVYCVDVYGFSDLPHSFYIGQSGTIFEGRGWYWEQFANGTREVNPLDEAGNLGWYSLCWLGGDNQQPSGEVIRRVPELVHYSRSTLGVGLKVQPACDWSAPAFGDPERRLNELSPGARLEQLARTLHNWHIPLDPPDRSVSAATNPTVPEPPRVAPPTPPLRVSAQRSVVQADDGDTAIFVTDGRTKEWIADRADFHRMCTEGQVQHAGRDRRTGEFRPLLISREALESLPTPGRLPLYPEGWTKPRTVR